MRRILRRSKRFWKGANEMPMWWFMFICNMIYSVVMIAGGWMMWKHCPKKINSFVGYRTSRSMRNAETWSFANQNCGRRWWKTGWIILIPTVLVQIPMYGATDAAISVMGLVICIVECTILIASIFPTEKALKREFADDGRRKMQ